MKHSMAIFLVTAPVTACAAEPLPSDPSMGMVGAAAATMGGSEGADDTSGTTGASSGGAVDAVCGDGVVEGDEACDDGISNGLYGQCNSECTGLATSCGDGVVQPQERCDDGNADDHDGCSSTCRWEVETVVASGGFSCAVTAGGAVKCWGGNSYGQLGLGDTNPRGITKGSMGESLPALDFGDDTVEQLALGSLHACALLHSGAVKCWGNNRYGQLGLGDTEHRGDDPDELPGMLPAVDFGSRTVVQLVGGFRFTCAVFDDARVRCWGNNDVGQLGQPRDELPEVGGAPGDMAMLQPVEVADVRSVGLGSQHACAVTAGDVQCWGRNDDGQLGTSTEMTSDGHLSDPFVALHATSGVRSVDGGSQHTCALTESGVKCWGANDSGQLGRVTSADGDPLAPGDTVDLGSSDDIQMLAVGSSHNCVLFETGAVKCWGANYSGQLGLGDTDSRGDTPSSMGPALPPVDLGGPAHAISAGSSHTCAVLADRRVKCWGSNRDGQLGLGDDRRRGWGPNDMGDNLPAVDLAF